MWNQAIICRGFRRWFGGCRGLRCLLGGGVIGRDGGSGYGLAVWDKANDDAYDYSQDQHLKGQVGFEEFKPVEALCSLLDIFGGVLDGEAGLVDLARLDYVSQGDADGKREGGDDFEVDQGFDADAAYFFEIAHAADAGHDGEEDDKRDKALDDIDEPDAHPFGLYRDGGCEVAE